MCAGITPIVDQNAPRMEGQMTILHESCGFPSIPGIEFSEDYNPTIAWFSYSSSRGMPFSRNVIVRIPGMEPL